MNKTKEFKLPDYKSGVVYLNRYFVNWFFKYIKENIYELKHDDLQYCRFGGKQGSHGILHEDLGFVDPSGGPFLGCEGFTINGKLVNKIYCQGEGIFFETQKETSE